MQDQELRKRTSESSQRIEQQSANERKPQDETYSPTRDPKEFLKLYCFCCACMLATLGPVLAGYWAVQQIIQLVTN